MCRGDVLAHKTWLCRCAGGVLHHVHQLPRQAVVMYKLQGTWTALSWKGTSFTAYCSDIRVWSTFAEQYPNASPGGRSRHSTHHELGSAPARVLSWGAHAIKTVSRARHYGICATENSYNATRADERHADLRLFFQRNPQRQWHFGTLYVYWQHPRTVMDIFVSLRARYRKVHVEYSSRNVPLISGVRDEWYLVRHFFYFVLLYLTLQLSCLKTVRSLSSSPGLKGEHRFICLHWMNMNG